MFKNWKNFAFWILVSEAAGIISALLTRDGVIIYGSEIIKPFLSPPPVIFPVVWTILYALMGYGAAKIYTANSNSGYKKSALIFFAIQLFINFCWCFIFFSLRMFGTACLWLVVLIICVAGMMITFHRVNKFASYIQIPYLIWLLFALYLNYAVWTLN